MADKRSIELDLPHYLWHPLSVTGNIALPFISTPWVLAIGLFFETVYCDIAVCLFAASNFMELEWKHK